MRKKYCFTKKKRYGEGLGCGDVASEEFTACAIAICTPLGMRFIVISRDCDIQSFPHILFQRPTHS